MANIKECPQCKGTEFGKGKDNMPIKPLNKKLMSMGSQKVFSICLSCGEIVSTKVEEPNKFRM